MVVIRSLIAIAVFGICIYEVVNLVRAFILQRKKKQPNDENNNK